MLRHKKILMLLFILALLVPVHVPVQVWAGGRHKSGDSSSSTYRSTYDKNWNRTGYIKRDKDRATIYDKDYNVKGYIKDGTIYDKDWGRKGYVK